MDQRLIKIAIGDITKLFLIGKNDITKKEIEGYYKSLVKEFNKRLTMDEFLFEANQYGIELTEIFPETLSIVL